MTDSTKTVPFHIHAFNPPTDRRLIRESAEHLFGTLDFLFDNADLFGPTDKLDAFSHAHDLFDNSLDFAYKLFGHGVFIRGYHTAALASLSETADIIGHHFDGEISSLFVPLLNSLHRLLEIIGETPTNYARNIRG